MKSKYAAVQTAAATAEVFMAQVSQKEPRHSKQNIKDAGMLAPRAKAGETAVVIGTTR